jgi:hypothetical protein
MRGIKTPYPATLTHISPYQITGGTHESFEYFRMMTRVKNYKSHTLVYTLIYAIYNIISDLTVLGMTPPEKNVGVVEHFLRKTMLFILIKPCGADFKVVCRKSSLKLLVNTVGIRRAGIITVALFIELVPYGYSYFRHYCYLLSLDIR